MILTIQSGNDLKQYALMSTTTNELKKNVTMCTAFAVVKLNSAMNTSGFLQPSTEITF